jgi:hypothetical protein
MSEHKGMKVISRTNGMIFVPQKDSDLTECLICGEKRTWMSEHIFFANGNNPVKVTICHKCSSEKFISVVFDILFKNFLKTAYQGKDPYDDLDTTSRLDKHGR